MVERLKSAIAKARARRTGEIPASRGSEAAEIVNSRQREQAWDAIRLIELDPAQLSRERIVTLLKRDPAHIAFDMLRTRLIKIASDRGWRRFGVTSASKGCGKTVVSANLAMSFARHPDVYSMTIDFDMRAPRLFRCFGQRERRDIRDMLDGSIPPRDYLLRIGPRSAVALNVQRVSDSAEVLSDPRTERTIMEIGRTLAPDIVVVDLPPLLVGDEALAFMPELDAVMLVAAAGQTRAEEIEECETLLKDETNLLGVILNKVSPNEISQYSYGYGYGYGYNYGSNR